MGGINSNKFGPLSKQSFKEYFPFPFADPSKTGRIGVVALLSFTTALCGK
jgi:hypothetical protein